MRPATRIAIALLLGLAASACQRGPDPMARQPDPETHPAARDAAGNTDSTGAPITSPEQRPDSPPEQDRSEEAMPPPNPGQ